MAEQVVTRNGKRFVLVEERQWHRLRRLAAKAKAIGDEALPDYPPADAQGNRPAVAYARVSIARKIVGARKAAGLSQEELARRAGVRQETISRIESGKHSPTIRTVDKIDRALKKAAQPAKRAGKKGK
ncbi:MAG: helix-turn-helix transcriptional regulator [Pirellulales bacterium]